MKEDRADAIRATMKGHGYPETMIYFGGDGTLAGVLVKVSKAPSGFDLTCVEGGKVYWASNASKFWAVAK